MDRTRIPFTVATVALLGLTLGCNGSSSGGVLLESPAPVALSAGDTIPIGTTVAIDISASYPLMAGTSTIRTRCFGEVAVIIERVPGSPEINTCQSDDGSGSQLNSVSDVSSVVYQLGPGASAHVTANP